MRWSFRAVLLVVSVLPIMTPAAASADSVAVTGQQIKITAIVRPAIYVVVNNQNQVQEIISNTSERETMPTIYKDSVKPENIQASTQDVQAQTSTLIKSVTVKPGILYERSATANLKFDKKVLPLISARK